MACAKDTFYKLLKTMQKWKKKLKSSLNTFEIQVHLFSNKTNQWVLIIFLFPLWKNSSRASINKTEKPFSLQDDSKTGKADIKKRQSADRFETT